MNPYSVKMIHSGGITVVIAPFHITKVVHESFIYF